MDTFLLLLRMLLLAVFGIAGVGKLLDLKGSVAAVEGFGVPEPFSRPFGYGLPILEIAIAVALIPVATTSWAATAGAILMGAFVVGIAVNLSRGRRPDCHCFGKLHSAPIGWQTLARNGVIAFAALLVAVAGPGANPVTWLGDLDGQGQLLLGLLLLAFAVLAWQSWAMDQISRTTEAMTARIDLIDGVMNGNGGRQDPGLAIGAEAPGFLLRAIEKGFVTFDQIRAIGKPVLLVFAEPSCSVCNTLTPKLARWAHDLGNVLTVAVISTGSEEENRKKVDRYGLEWVLLQDAREATMAYRVPGVPSAVLIASDGRVADRTVYGADAIITLLEGIADVTGPAPSAEGGRAARQSGASQDLVTAPAFRAVG